MPKAPKRKWYAVRIGREGPKIYTTWDECKANTLRVSGAIYKSYNTEKQAVDWLNTWLAVNATVNAAPPNQLPATNGANPVRSTPSAPALGASSNAAETADPTPTIIKLSAEQKAVLDDVKKGKSVFFTGSAGTGKSVLLRQIVEALGGRSAVGQTLAITAATGIASVNINGTTLHSWAGIGLGTEPAKRYGGMFNGQPKYAAVKERWVRTQALIIDEISMVDGELFDKLENIARIVRQDDRPFGGIQLILSGDFCQLPPVPQKPEKNKEAIAIRFAFDAATWPKCVGNPVTLTHVFRQKDQAFVDMLNSMRFGVMEPKTIEAFQNLSRPVVYEDGIEATELYPTRFEVENANKTRLTRLPGDLHTYTAVDTCGMNSNKQPLDRRALDRVLDRLVVPKVLTFKIGAQVMLLKNFAHHGLVNGSIGKIVKFSTHEENQKRPPPGPGPAHGPPGDDQFVVEPSDTYNMRRAPAGRRWPVVEFIMGTGTKKQMIFPPHEFTVVNSDGETEASRTQVPLTLAWAMSIHKSQGQTLERVRIDCGKIFECGQAYVALSRATSLRQLQVLNFNPDRVKAHPRVLEWVQGGHSSNNFDNDLDSDDEMAMAHYYD